MWLWCEIMHMCMYTYMQNIFANVCKGHTMALGVFFDYSLLIEAESFTESEACHSPPCPTDSPSPLPHPWGYMVALGPPSFYIGSMGVTLMLIMASALSAEPSPHQSLYFLLKATQKCQKMNRFKISCHSHDYANTTKHKELTFLPKEKNGEFIRALTIIKEILATVGSLLKTRS